MSSTDTEKNRPARFTMEGMIYNADQVLTSALNPDHTGIPKDMFTRCRGVVLLQTVTAGLIFTGTGGSGVMMARSKTDGHWSPPCAVDIFGYGGGAIAGADVSHTLTFVMDLETMKDFANKPQTKFTANASITMAKYGREGVIGQDAPDHGTITVSLSKGAFMGIGLNLGTLQISKKVNEKFYGKKLKATEVLYDTAVDVPSDSGIAELHEKLKMLEEGMTWVPTEEDIDKSTKLMSKAEESAEFKAEDESAMAKEAEEA